GRTRARRRGPATNGPRSSRGRARRPSARLGSHPRASAGPLLRLDDRPSAMPTGIDANDSRGRRGRLATAARFANRSRSPPAARAQVARAAPGSPGAIRYNPRMQLRRGNLYLVGLMGAGKTTLGRLLARRLGKRYVDADHELEGR